MTVAKAVVLGGLIAGCLGAQDRGGPMLVLGTFSNEPGPVSSTSAGFQPFAASAWNPAPLQLGFSGGVSNFQPPAVASSPAFSQPSTIQPSFTPPPAPAPPGPQPAPAMSVYDAYINLGNGPYPDAATLTTGNPQPWYVNAKVANFFGGSSSDLQRGQFDNAIVERVAQTFRLSGVPINLTVDPTASATHTISVVSNAVSGSLNQAIGMTYLGGNGFHFIDQSVNSAQTLDQLEWIVAHNVAHELMLAFGVPEVHDTAGNFVDARNATWRMMIDPNAHFSTGASLDLLSRNFQAKDSTALLMGAQLLEPRPVPEPATVGLWGLALGALALARKVRGGQG